jgi:MFS family permease
MGVDWNEISPAVFWGFLFPALGGFMFGYDIGATSHAITDDQVLLDYHAIGEPVLAGVLHGASLYGALIMSVILFNYGDSIGRKRTMIMSSAL